MRVEDLDSGRVRPHVEREQLEDLHAIGLEWDGPVVRQSERRERYERAIEDLAARDLLYECFCSRAEIREAASAPHGPLPEGAYPGTCRALAPAELRARRAGGRSPALRLRAGAVWVDFEDRRLGRQSGIVDDFVIRRGDGVPAYNLAVVVDDGVQGVTEVVRGADLLETTPRQLLLGRLLGLERPIYAHVPLVLAPDGSRLAKRHGPITLRERPEGPAGVLSALAATLELADPGEPVTPALLLQRFDPARLTREPTRLAAATL